MNKEGVLHWIRSFEGVTPENCPDFESLKDGVVLGIIFNQITDTPIDLTNLRPVDRRSETWVSFLRNIRSLTNAVRPAFDARNIPLTADVTGIARGTNPESLSNLVESFVLYSVKGPKKPDGLQRIKQLPRPGQLAIKALLEATLPPKKAAEPAVEPTQAHLDLEAELARLREENGRLLNEKQQLLEAAAKRSPGLSDLQEAESKRQILAQRSSELDIEIQKREGIVGEKERLQAELKALNGRLEELTHTLAQSQSGVEGFRGSTDPRAIKLLAEIDQAEKRLRPEFVERVRADNARMKAELQGILGEVTELRRYVGDVDDGDDDVVTVLNNEVEALVDRDHRLKEETMAAMVRAEAIERLKSQQSYLAKLRSSAQFLKPE
jgi:hypothetical protein